jgi:hypothetical protein
LPTLELGTQDSDQREMARVTPFPPVAVTPAPPALVAGISLIHYLGRDWLVERVNDHAGHGPLLAIRSLESDDIELICGWGCDGPFELLAE